MARHKDTYSAKLNEQRRVSLDDQGSVHIALLLQSGDRGRPIDLCITDQQLEELIKRVREARRQQAIENARKEERQRVSGLQARVSELERKNRALEGVIRQVREAVRPEQPPVPNLRERLDAITGSDVTH